MLNQRLINCMVRHYFIPRMKVTFQKSKCRWNNQGHLMFNHFGLKSYFIQFSWRVHQHVVYCSTIVWTINQPIHSSQYRTNCYFFHVHVSMMWTKFYNSLLVYHATWNWLSVTIHIHNCQRPHNNSCLLCPVVTSTTGSGLRVQGLGLGSQQSLSGYQIQQSSNLTQSLTNIECHCSSCWQRSTWVCG